MTASKNNQKVVFDSYRDNYEAEVQRSISFSGLKHDFFLQAKVDFLRSLFASHFVGKRPLLLDVGCGVGRMHPLLMPITSHIVGCDVSLESLSRARTENQNCGYLPIEHGKLPMGDDAVEVSLATCVLHHVPPQEWPSFIGEMRRVTRPGGLVILIEHNPWNPGTRLAVARCPFDRDAVLASARRSRALLQSAALDAVQSAHILLFPTAAAPARRVEKLLAKFPLGAQYCAWGVA